MMDEKAILMGLLTKSLNKSEEEVSDLLYEKPEDSDEIVIKDGALNLVLDADADRVKKLKTSTATPQKITEAFEQGYNKGKLEVMQKFEGDLKALYEIESDSEGLDLVKEVVSTVSQCELNENVKTHPEYLTLAKSTVPKNKYKELEDQFNDFKANQERIARFSIVRNHALKELSSLNPIESQNVKVAQTHRDNFYRDLEPYDFELKDDGNHIVKKNGEIVENEHGNPVSFSEFVRGVASNHYEFSQGDQRGNAGNLPIPGSNGGKIIVPKSKEEFLTKYNELRQQGKIAESIALNEAYQASLK